MPLEKKELQIQPLIFAVIQCLLVLFVFFFFIPVWLFLFVDLFTPSCSSQIFFIDLSLMLGLSNTLLRLMIYLLNVGVSPPSPIAHIP